MRFDQLKKTFPTQVAFSTQQVLLVDETFNRENLFHWQKSGKIIQLKKGRYAFADRLHDEYELFVIAGQLIEPSYISLESALSYYGLIPEGVFSVTSITSKKTQTISNDVGTFVYRSLQPRLIWGYEIIPHATGSIFMANLEKTLLDYLYLYFTMNSIEAMSERRLHRSAVRGALDRERFDRYVSRFGKKALTHRATLFLDHLDHDSSRTTI